MVRPDVLVEIKAGALREPRRYENARRPNGQSPDQGQLHIRGQQPVGTTARAVSVVVAGANTTT